MILPLLTGALVATAVIAVLFLWIRSQYRLALTSVEEKHAGMLFYYRYYLSALFRGQPTREGIACLILYIALHLFVPLAGFGLFLKSDANFLVMLASLLWSYELVQRVFPGSSNSETDADDRGEIDSQ